MKSFGSCWDRRDLRLSLWFSATRLVLVWCVAAPVYAAFSSASELRSDIELFRPGGESLLVLLEAQSSFLPTLSVALVIIGGFTYAAQALLSTVAWILIQTRQFQSVQSLQKQFNACVGQMLAIGIGAATSVVTLLGCWYFVFVSIGAWLEPMLGERGADLVQLAAFAITLCGAAAIGIVADVARALVIAHRCATRHAVSSAINVCLRAWSKLCLNAICRLLPAIFAHVATSWLVAHYHMLSGPTWAFFIALAAVELAAFLSITLRVGWIAYLLTETRIYADNSALMSRSLPFVAFL